MTDVNELEHCNHNNHNQGHLHIADILLTAGADVNQQCCQGASPLAVSAQVIIGMVAMMGDKRSMFESPFPGGSHVSVIPAVGSRS